MKFYNIVSIKNSRPNLCFLKVLFITLWSSFSLPFSVVSFLPKRRRREKRRGMAGRVEEEWKSPCRQRKGGKNRFDIWRMFSAFPSPSLGKPAISFSRVRKTTTVVLSSGMTHVRNDIFNLRCFSLEWLEMLNAVPDLVLITLSW